MKSPRPEKNKKLQSNYSVMYGYSCIVFIDFMPKGKSFSDYT